jgi:beta-fructofuranosidase
MRPQFHFTASSGWINDPHGITFHEGQYHLFYQYLPDSLVWGSRCRWGHATSPDLISFVPRPIALEPGDGDHGIWTGSLILSDGVPTIFYTAVSESNLDAGRVRSAHPMDAHWDIWQKGPVVVDTPSDPSVVAFRDPFVMRDGDGWRMFVGGSGHQGEALALTYVSDDSVHWTDDGVALSRLNTPTDPVATGSMWECPQFFELDGHHLMVTSVMDRGVLQNSIYAVGELREGRFAPRTWGQLSYGESYYAPSFFRDKNGQPSVMFWMREVCAA